MVIGLIHFEKVRHLDGPSFFALRRASILAGCSTHYPVSQLELWTDSRLDASLHEPLPVHFYFAKIDNVIAASGMLDVASGRIDAMFVLPSFFGQGIGREFMEHLEGIARNHGLAALSLDATLNAADFYRSMGFRGDERSIFHSPRGVSIECVPMTKSLG
jgi:GNAT superfamily N-acetyltransferase